MNPLSLCNCRNVTENYQLVTLNVMHQMLTNSTKYVDVRDPHRPPRPASIDAVIGGQGGSTSLLELDPRYVQRSKRQPLPSLEGRVVELTRENGRLRHEVRYYMELNRAAMAMKEGVEGTFVSLKETLVAYENHRRKATLEHEQ